MAHGKANYAVLADPCEPEQPLICQPHQMEFAKSPSYATFMAAGWGAGKSYALLQWLFFSAFLNPPKTSGMVLLPTFPLMDEFMTTQLLQAFAPVMTDYSKSRWCLYLEGGRRLLCRSAHIPQRVELSNLCYLGMDEAGLMDSSIFYRAVARVRDKRAKLLRIGMTGVPIWGWLKHAFDKRDDAKRRILHYTTDHNKKLHPDAAANLREAVPAKLRQCFIEGRFVPPGGSVFPELDEKKHLIPWTYKRDLETVIVYDWSLRTPHVLWIQNLPEGYMINGKRLPQKGGVIFDEDFPTGPITTEQLCLRSQAKGYHIDVICGDKAGKARDATSGIDQFHVAQTVLGVQRMKWATAARLVSIPNGINHVKRVLEPMNGPPLLYFRKELAAEHNPRAVWNAMLASSYPQEKDGQPLSDVPVKDGVVDHARDGVRYYCINFHPILRLQTRVRQYA